MIVHLTAQTTPAPHNPANGSWPNSLSRQQSPPPLHKAQKRARAATSTSRPRHARAHPSRCLGARATPASFIWPRDTTSRMPSLAVPRAIASPTACWLQLTAFRPSPPGRSPCMHMTRTRHTTTRVISDACPWHLPLSLAFARPCLSLALALSRAARVEGESARPRGSGGSLRPFSGALP